MKIRYQSASASISHFFVRADRGERQSYVAVLSGLAYLLLGWVSLIESAG